MYELISSDPYFIHIYERVAKDYLITHVLKVVYTVEDILKQLEFDEKTIDNAMIVAFLHDIGKADSKKNYVSYSLEKAKNYFIDKQLDTGSNIEILDAIKYHNSNFEHNFIASIIYLVDFLTVNLDNRKNKTIRKFEVIIDDVQVIVNINTRNDDISEYINKIDLESFVKNFAKVINRIPVIHVNEVRWENLELVGI